MVQTGLPQCLALLLPVLLIGCGKSHLHPSSASLVQQWRDHREELDQLLKMFLQDKALNRVAPDFTVPGNPTSIGVTAERVAAYRSLLDKTGVGDGIEGYGKKDQVLFYVSTGGLAVSGSGKGFAYLAGPPELLVPDLDAHVIKALAGREGSFTAYQSIQDGWYLFYDYED